MRLFKRFKLPKLGTFLQGNQGELWVVVKRNCWKDCFYIKSVRTGSIFHQAGFLYSYFKEPIDMSSFVKLVRSHGWRDDEEKWHYEE